MRFSNKANPLTTVVRHIRSLAELDETAELKDSELLHRYVGAGEEAAFQALVERHGPMVLGVCRRVLRREHDAEDAFQATFLVFARKAASVRKFESVGSWLYGVAFRLAVRAKTQAAQRRIRERRGADMRSGNQGDAVTSDELWSAVDQELARLPEVDRAPLVLCYFQGKTQDSAAHHLGYSKSTFRRRLEHGLTKLRSRLRRRGVALGTGLLGVALLQEEVRAALPKELLGATARAAHLFVTSKAAAAGLVSQQAISLAESGLKSMVASKMKLAIAIIFTLATIATGTGVMMRRAFPSTPAASGSESQPVAEKANPRPPEFEPGAEEAVKGTGVAIAKFGTTDLYHPGAAIAMTFSPDGKILASLGQDGTVIFWDGGSGKEIRKLGKPHQPVFSIGDIVFSANGKIAAAVENSVITGVWDVQTGKEMSAIPDCKFSNVTAVALSADGSAMAIADSKNSIRLVDTASGKPGARLVGHDAAVTSLAFSSDGKCLLSGGRDQVLRLWQTDTGEEQRAMEGHRDAIWAVALSPDGKTAASMSGDGTTRLWNAESGKELRRFSNPHMLAPTAAHMPCQFGFSPDGKSLVTVLSPERAIWWDVASGKELRQFEAPVASVFLAALSPDGKSFAQVDHTGRMRLIETAQGHDLRSSEGHRDSVLAIAISPDGKTLASGGADRVICLWDRASGRQLRRCEGHSGQVAFVGFTADGKSVISASSDSHDNNISFWDVASGKEIRSIRKSGGAVALSPDGKILAYRSGRESLTLLDAVSGKELRQLIIGDSIFTPLEFSPDNQSLVCGGFDGPFHIYDLASGKETRVLDARRDVRLGVDCLKYSPVGEAAVVAVSDGTYRLWDMARPREVRSLGVKKPPMARTYGHFIYFELYAISPDAKMIAVPAGNGNAIALIEMATGKERQRITGHLGPIGALAFAPDGKTLISGSADGTLLTWDLNQFESEVSRKEEKLSTKELESLWASLAGDDSEQAYRAIRTLQLSPQQTAAFLKERVHPVAEVRPEQIERFIAQLDSEKIEERAAATTKLEKLGELAEPALRKARADTLSAEVRQRIELLLQKLEAQVLSDDTLQALRAIEVLEYLDVADGKQTLERVAGGAEGANLTREAKAALDFQAHRVASKKSGTKP